MNHPESVQAEQGIASLLAGVAGNAQDVHILMVGAGRGASALLEVFPRYNWVHLDAIADINPEALAFPPAEAQGITCCTDVEQALAGFHGDLVVDVTGDPAMDIRLRAWTDATHVELISGKSAKLLFDMSRHQVSDIETIHVQNAHMLLLDNLLDISIELSHRMPLAVIAEKTLASIYRPAMAVKGLAVLFANGDGAAEIVGAVGLKKPASGLPMQPLRKLCCAGLSAEETSFRVLSEPLRVDTPSDGKTPFNVVLPFCRGHRLSGLLLFAMPGVIGPEQKRVLEIASIHLRIVTTTLDQYQKLEKMAALDPLTGVYNRRMFRKKLQQEVTRCRRNKHGHLSCAFIDMDDFKSVNDCYSHLAGDEALKHAVACIRQCIRESDTIARYGGDEFVLLLPSDRSDDVAHVHHIGERILERIAASPVPAYPNVHISASMGMATQSASVVDIKTLIKQADKAAYEAKNAGKSQMKSVMDFPAA